MQQTVVNANAPHTTMTTTTHKQQGLPHRASHTTEPYTLQSFTTT